MLKTIITKYEIKDKHIYDKQREIKTSDIRKAYDYKLVQFPIVKNLKDIMDYECVSIDELFDMLDTKSFEYGCYYFYDEHVKKYRPIKTRKEVYAYVRELFNSPTIANRASLYFKGENFNIERLVDFLEWNLINTLDYNFFTKEKTWVLKIYNGLIMVILNEDNTVNMIYFLPN